MTGENIKNLKRMKNIFKIIFICICCICCGGCVIADDPNDPGLINSYSVCLNGVKEKLSKIQLGMKEDDVIAILGNPPENNITRTAASKSEQWVYDAQSFDKEILGRYAYEFDTLVNDEGAPNPRYYLYFDNGILTSTQGF